MRSRFLITIAVSSLLLIAGSRGALYAGDNKRETAKGGSEELISLDDLSWLVGRWVGKGFGGVCEEVWQPSSGGSMIGTFRLIVDGKAQFYELMTITMESGKPTMKLKHFNADLTGWEEKDKFVTFEFVSMLDSGILFEGLKYHKVTDGALTVTVMVGSSDGETSEQLIEFNRVEL